MLPIAKQEGEGSGGSLDSISMAELEMADNTSSTSVSSESANDRPLLRCADRPVTPWPGRDLRINLNNQNKKKAKDIIKKEAKMPQHNVELSAVQVQNDETKDMDSSKHDDVRVKMAHTEQEPSMGNTQLDATNSKMKFKINRKSDSSATSSSTLVTTLPSSSEMVSDANGSSNGEQKASTSGSDEFVASSASEEASPGNNNGNSGHINPTCALYWEYNYGSSLRERGSISSEQYSKELCIYLRFAFVFCVFILIVLLTAYFYGN